MIRIATICAAFVLLTAADCSKTIDATINTLTADPALARTAFMEVEAGEEEVEAVVVEPPVAEIVPPEPPRCDNWIWRGVEYDCHGNWVRDL